MLVTQILLTVHPHCAALSLLSFLFPLVVGLQSVKREPNLMLKAKIQTRRRYEELLLLLLPHVNLTFSLSFRLHMSLNVVYRTHTHTLKETLPSPHTFDLTYATWQQPISSAQIAQNPPTKLCCVRGKAVYVCVLSNNRGIVTARLLTSTHSVTGFRDPAAFCLEIMNNVAKMKMHPHPPPTPRACAVVQDSVFFVEIPGFIFHKQSADL